MVKSTSQKSTGVAKKYYRTWSKEHNINNIETLAEYYNVKYNDVERYELLKHYVKSIDSGMMSPLSGFDKYEEYRDRIENELVGLTAVSGIQIKSQSYHFLERVFGTWHDPKHNDDIRNGISLEDIKDAILNGKIKITHGGDSILHSTEICGVTINPHTGNLIQSKSKVGDYMIFMLSKKDFNFLKDKIPYAYKLVTTKEEKNNNIYFDVKEVSDFQDENQYGDS